VWIGQEVQALPRDVGGVGAVISTIRVVAAALYDSQGRILIAERPAGKHMAGRWEFPGGKVASGESDAAALARELHEELGVNVTESRELMTLHHDYADRSVELSLWIVERYIGVPQSLDQQRLKWVEPARLTDEDILEADRPFVEALQRLPQRSG
jgi:8-oxo-dGTP diphosphatase